MTWPKAMPIVEVEWIDSNGISGWQATEDADKMLNEGVMQCCSSGYLYRRDRDHVTIAQNQSHHGHIDMMMDIPRRAVKSIRVLQKAKKRGK